MTSTTKTSKKYLALVGAAAVFAAGVLLLTVAGTLSTSSAHPKSRDKRNNKEIVQVKMVQLQQLQQVAEALNQSLFRLVHKMSL
jgi:hypothetical protein